MGHSSAGMPAAVHGASPRNNSRHRRSQNQHLQPPVMFSLTQPVSSLSAKWQTRMPTSVGFVGRNTHRHEPVPRSSLPGAGVGFVGWIGIRAIELERRLRSCSC